MSGFDALVPANGEEKEAAEAGVAAAVAGCRGRSSRRSGEGLEDPRPSLLRSFQTVSLIRDPHKRWRTAPPDVYGSHRTKVKDLGRQVALRFHGKMATKTNIHPLRFD